MPFAFNIIGDGNNFFVLERIESAETGTEISTIIRNFCQGVVDLIIDPEFFNIKICKRYFTVFAKWHLPITIECTAGIMSDHQTIEL